jgi:hypothetical protein
MNSKDFDKKVAELKVLEDSLIDKIASTGNSELMDLFLDWQSIREELNTNAVNALGELIDKIPAWNKSEGNLMCKVFLRQMNKEYLSDGKIVLSHNEIFNWFEKGMYKKHYTEYDTI